MRRRSLVAATATILWLIPVAAIAQQPEPLPRFDVDVRGFSVRVGQDTTTATDLGITAGELPSRLNGFDFGGNVYVLRGQGVALGVGAEGLFGRGLVTVPASASAGTAAFQVATYITSVAGNVSLNFGHRRGWSYLSTGAGPMRINSFLGGAPLAEPPGKVTINFGGGARWFTYSHVAIGFDVRFYLTEGNPSDPPFFPGRGKKRVLLVCGGFSIQ